MKAIEFFAANEAAIRGAGSSMIFFSRTGDSTNGGLIRLAFVGQKSTPAWFPILRDDAQGSEKLIKIGKSVDASADNYQAFLLGVCVLCGKMPCISRGRVTYPKPHGFGAMWISDLLKTRYTEVVKYGIDAKDLLNVLSHAEGSVSHWREFFELLAEAKSKGKGKGKGRQAA